MNNIEYGQIINYFAQNRIVLILITVLFLITLLFLISKILRKSGLFLLVFTFLLDKLIIFIPIDLYSTFPNLSFVITIMYFLGLFIFLFKIFKNIFKRDKPQMSKDKDKTRESKLKKIFKFTGSIPLLIMLLVSVLNNYMDIFSTSLISNLTSLSFLFMAFITLLNTYKYVDKKNIDDEFDKINFKDLNNEINKENVSKKVINSNKGRKTLKNNKKLKIEEFNYENSKVKNKYDEIGSYKAEEINYEMNDNYDSNRIEDEISNANLISLVSRGFDFPINKTILHIQNLVDGSSISHVSQRCIAKIIEDEEYKVDLEFKEFNEYDYGRFIDILMIYSKDKKSYKFKLELIPYKNKKSKIVFYDPSEIFDSVKMFQGSFQGKNISMNFPKYKINFVSGN